jgi:predicted RNase H-like nuclease (RuvC/YqgF family)
MSRKGTIILPVLIVLIIISLSFAVVSFYLYQKEHAQNIQLQDQVTELNQRQRVTEGKLEDTKKAASELTLKLQEANSKVDSLTEELTQQKSTLTETSHKLDQVNSDLQQQKSLREDLEGRLKTAQDEGKQIKEKIKIIQQQKAELEDKIKNMEVGSEGVELGRVIVNGEAAVADDTAKGKAKDKVSAVAVKSQKVGKKPAVPAGLEGKVMIVNKEFNFAVINLGSRDNINVGDAFAIYHDGKYLGDLKVEKVHDSMSAAGFAPELKDFIKENDKITQKAK